MVLAATLRITIGRYTNTYCARDELSSLNLDNRALTRLNQLLLSFESYFQSCRKVSHGKLRYFGTAIPECYREPGLALVTMCADGVVVTQFQKGFLVGEAASAVGVLGGQTEMSIREVTPILSGGYALIVDSDKPPELTSEGLKLQIFSQSNDGIKTEQISALVCAYGRINGADAVQRSGLPVKILDVSSLHEIALSGYACDANLPYERYKEGKLIVARAPIRLPVFWDRLQVFVHCDDVEWPVGMMPQWAEQNILADVAYSRIRNEQFSALDPSMALRREFQALFKQFDDLLGNATREEELQIFIRKHPNLIDPAYAKVWSKLPFGNKESDFVIRNACGDYLLVELERADHSLFTKNGDLRKELNHAISQIDDWRRYIADNLSTVQRELGLEGITPNPKGLIVIGRSSTLNEANRRKLQSMCDRSPVLRILTYDDLRDQAQRAVENLIGGLTPAAASGAELYFPKNDEHAESALDNLSLDRLLPIDESSAIES